MDFADPSIRRSWIAEKNMQVFSFRDPANPMLVVDLFAESPFPFDDLWNRSESVAVGDQRVRVSSLRDLIAMKKIAGRPVDIEGIEALEEIARNRKGIECLVSTGEEEWTWENTRRWQRTTASQATPEQRLAWLEEVIALFHDRDAREVRFDHGPEGRTWRSNFGRGMRQSAIDGAPLVDRSSEGRM